MTKLANIFTSEGIQTVLYFKDKEFILKNKSILRHPYRIDDTNTYKQLEENFKDNKNLSEILSLVTELYIELEFGTTNKTIIELLRKLDRFI